MPVKGYGIGLVGGRKQIVETPPPTPDELASQQAQDIHSIKERAAPALFEQKYFITFAAANGLGSIDVSNTPVNALIVNVISGTLDFWLGDDAAPGGTPDFRFTNVGFPVQIMLSLKPRRFTFLSQGGAVVAKVIVQAL